MRHTELTFLPCLNHHHKNCTQVKHKESVSSQCLQLCINNAIRIGKVQFFVFVLCELTSQLCVCVFWYSTTDIVHSMLLVVDVEETRMHCASPYIQFSIVHWYDVF